MSDPKQRLMRVLAVLLVCVLAFVGVVIADALIWAWRLLTD